MGKTDIKTNDLFVWDRFNNSEVEEALTAVYDHAQRTATRTSTWYWTSIRKKKRTSVVLRLTTFALVMIGTLLPLLAGLGDDTSTRLTLTQLGVGALAAGGLLQLADRVFGWSSGWIRYITTVTAVEGLTRKFELDWAGYIIGKAGALTRADVEPLFLLAKQLESDVFRLQGEETDKWVTEFNSGVAELAQVIKTQRESGQMAVTELRAALASQTNAAQISAKAKAPGGVAVTLKHTGPLQPVFIALDEGEGREFLGTAWVQRDVSPGLHSVRVSTLGTAPYSVIQMVDVPASGIGVVEVTLS